MVVMEKTKKSGTGASSGEGDQKHQIVLNNLYELLVCPVCTDVMSPPIYQCTNGHALCSVCKFQVKSCCPICRINMGSTSIRCLVLEKLVSQPLELSYDCPYPGSQCSITGGIRYLVRHLKDYHNVSMLKGDLFTHPYSQSHEKKNATGMLGVVSCFGQKFCYHFEDFLLGTSSCYIAFLRFMGDEIEAKKFKYSLEIDGNCRKMSWQGIPSSIRHSHQQNQESLDGLVIPRKMALFFSDGNEKALDLLVKGRIWKE
ncbi:E3 ubiquitin protein ligase SINAT2 [Tanacetum coccineum]